MPLTWSSPTGCFSWSPIAQACGLLLVLSCHCQLLWVSLGAARPEHASMSMTHIHDAMLASRRPTPSS